MLLYTIVMNNKDVDDLLDISELAEYNSQNNDSFTFDNIYSINKELDTNTEYNNYNLDIDPENKDIKRVILKIQDTPRVQTQNYENIKIQQISPKKNANILKAQTIKEESNITYEDIIDRMGMYVLNGKLHLKENSTNNLNSGQNITNANINSNQYFNNDNTYSYIHNKYFKDYMKPEEQEFNLQNPVEYRNFLIKQIIHNYRLKKQIKSKKIYIPGEGSFNISSNIDISNLNKLFNFSKR